MPPGSSLTAADVMTPDPRTCSKFSTVLEAVMIFRDADCGAVPVLDDGHAAGVVTDRDVALALADYEEELPGVPVSQIMTKEIVSVSPDTPLNTIVDQFGGSRVRRLLVIDSQNQLKGIIGWSDIAAHVPDRKIGRAVTEVVQRP
jgi:CBS domain-containing protein